MGGCAPRFRRTTSARSAREQILRRCLCRRGHRAFSSDCTPVSAAGKSNSCARQVRTWQTQHVSAPQHGDLMGPAPAWEVADSAASHLPSTPLRNERGGEAAPDPAVAARRLHCLNSISPSPWMPTGGNLFKIFGILCFLQFILLRMSQYGLNLIMGPIWAYMGP